jgi:hypothetical protein
MSDGKRQPTVPGDSRRPPLKTPKPVARRFPPAPPPCGHYDCKVMWQQKFPMACSQCGCYRTHHTIYNSGIDKISCLWCGHRVRPAKS